MNSDPFTTVIEIFQHTQAEMDAEREATQAKRMATLTENFQADLSAWLPYADLLAALAPAAPVRKSHGGDHVYLSRAIVYQDQAGSINYYDSGSPRNAPSMAIEFGDSSAWKVSADIKLAYPKGQASGNPTVREVAPAILAELGQLFHLLNLRAADEAAQAREREANTFFYNQIWDFQTESEMRAFYADQYVPLYGEAADKVKAIQGEVANRARNAEYAAQAERARAEAEARAATYEHMRQAAQAEADSLWHPFTVYRIEYGAVVSDGDGGAGPALDNVYSLDAAPDAEGWYRRVNMGRVTKVRIPGAVLVEEIKVEAPEQARRLAVCKHWTKAGALFILPPDTVLIGTQAGVIETAGVDEDSIPF